MSSRVSVRLAPSVLLALSWAVGSCRDDRSPVAPEFGSRLSAPAGPQLATVGGPPVILVGAGDISKCSSAGDDQTAALILGMPADASVFDLGDNAGVSGTTQEYADCYGPSWGQFKDRTHPVPGNKDYVTPSAQGYFDYFGAAAGAPGQGYYSYDVGGWHVIALNSNIAMNAGSAQELWLKSDLAASTALCTIAYWHYPRFYSYSSQIRNSVKPLWDALYSAGAEVILNADVRFYERFAPQDPAGNRDDQSGIREFIVGTGGFGSYPFGDVLPNSEVRNSGTNGVLKLTLTDTSYTWEFVPVAGKTFTDSGTGYCHPSPAPVARPGGPYTAESQVLFDGRYSADAQGDYPLTYQWSFGDGTTSTSAAPLKTYAASGVYTVKLVVTDARGNQSDTAATTATIQSVPPSVRLGPDQWTAPGGSITVRMTIADPGAASAPWNYTVTWDDGTTTTGSATTLSTQIVLTHAYPVAGTYRVRAEVTDNVGALGSHDMGVTVSAIAPSVDLLVTGDIAGCGASNDDKVAQLVSTLPGVLIVTGDIAYPHGGPVEFRDCYNPRWGPFLPRTYAVQGNHEYESSGAIPAFDYFGAAIGPRGKGFYSYDHGNWHVVVLNQYMPYSASSEQIAWLNADLAANTRPCIVAAFHEPYFHSASPGGTQVQARYKPIWDALYAFGTDLVLNGHQHFYERFAPQDPNGVADPANGIVEIIAGTGGYSLWSLPTVITPNSVVRGNDPGVLKVTLGPNGYSWEFVPIPGKSFTDSGTATCH